MSTENTTHTTPAIGTPEYDAAMVAKFDSSQAPSTETAPSSAAPEAPAEVAKPEWCPDKFWKDGKVDQEGLAASYKELEKTKGKPTTAGEVDPALAAAATKDDAAQALDSVGLNYAELSEQFQRDGELSTQNREALRKAGIPDAMVDAYIAGQQAQADGFLNSVYESVGGQEKFTELVTWAKSGLSKAELDSYNRTVNGSDAGATKLAVAGLKARFDAANGVDPQLVQAATGEPVQGPVFRSNAELMTAMNDPRYKSDAAYRNDVIQRLNRSSIM